MTLLLLFCTVRTHLYLLTCILHFFLHIWNTPAWRTLFSISVLIMNSLNFLHLKMSLFCLHFWRTCSLNIEFSVGRSFLFALKHVTPFSVGFHCFCWNVTKTCALPSVLCRISREFKGCGRVHQVKKGMKRGTFF